MLWKNYKIITIGFGILFSVFFSVLLSSHSYATSVSCDMSDYLNSSNNTNVEFSCDTSSLNQSVVWNYYGSVTYSSNPGSNPSIQLCLSNCNGNLPISSYFLLNFVMSNQTFPLTIEYLTKDFYGFTYGGHFNKFKWVNSAGYVFSFILNISDEVSFESSSPSGSISITENGTYDVTNYAVANVDVSPEIIEGSYHDDLLKINNSILVCGAICLVLYFFYCIYRMIIKSTGGY